MSVLDNFISGYTNDAAESDGPPPTAPMPQAPQAQGSTLNVLDLLARAMQPATPQVPKPNTAGILPMALMRFAAEVTRPKAYGQSTANAILGAGSDALAYADKLKGDAVASAERSAMTQAKLAESEAQTRNANLGSVARSQEIAQRDKAGPLELDALRTRIDAAKDERTLTALKIRVEKVQLQYADAMEKAKLAEKNARTESERAQAAAAFQHAALYKRQAEELLNLAKIRAAGGSPDGKVQWQRNETLPGMRPTEYNRISGETRPAKFVDVQSALSWAEKEADAMVTAKTLQPSERDARVAQLVRDNVVLPGGRSASGTVTPAATTSPGTPALTPNDQADYNKAKQLSIDRAKPQWVLLGDGKTKHYFYNGAEISAEEYSRLTGVK